MGAIRKALALPPDAAEPRAMGVEATKLLDMLEYIKTNNFHKSCDKFNISPSGGDEWDTAVTIQARKALAEAGIAEGEVKS